MIHWIVGGCQFFWDSNYTQKISDSSYDNLVQLQLDQDYELDFYGQEPWASNNLTEPSVYGAFDDSKELQPDEEFPADGERAAATRVLTQEKNLYAWSIGTGDGYDFQAGNDIGEYLYYIVELDQEGNAVEIGGDAGNGMKLLSIEYDPEKIEDKGITHGLVTVSNELPRPESINVVIKKTDDAENSTNYLAGAVFKLMYRADSSGAFAGVSKESVPELDNESKFTVPKTGITLMGLVDGEYQLQEISPPAGYVVVDENPVTFTVSGGAITSTEGTITGVRYTAATATSDAEFIIPNTPGEPLPGSGGPGTRGFLYTGLALMVFAAMAALVWRRKRV